MRIVHFACVAPPEIGGIGSVALREVTLLRGRGMDARLVVPKSRVMYSQGERVERSFVEVVDPLLRVGNAAVLSDLDRWVSGADVLHIHYPFYGTAEFLLTRYASRIPTVVTFHMDAQATGLKGMAFFLYRHLVQQSLLARASRILVSSFDYARRSSLATLLSAHPERVRELPFGVDLDFFSPGPSQAGRFGIPEGAPVILFVGGLDRAHAFKGTHELIHAFAGVDLSAHLLIVGDGDLKSVYQEEARRLGLSDRVHFPGRVNDVTLRDAYRSARMFVLPSTSAAEAFGLVILEAAACQLPVIASDVPGVRTIVRRGETGLLVQPKDMQGLRDAMTQLLINEDTRRDMGERARQFVLEQFSWDRHVDGLMEVYREVCASRS